MGSITQIRPFVSKTLSLNLRFLHMSQRVIAALYDKLVHGNLLLLGDAFQVLSQCQRHSEGLVDILCFFNSKHTGLLFL